MTDNVEQIAQQLFESELKPAHSLNLQLENTITPGINPTKVCAQLLVKIFIVGMKHFFGKGPQGTIFLDELSDADFQKVNDYFHSINYNIKYYVYSVEQKAMMLEQYTSTDQNELSAWPLNITYKNMVYTIVFENFISNNKT